jgi:hypothetical protein
LPFSKPAAGGRTLIYTRSCKVHLALYLASVGAFSFLSLQTTFAQESPSSEKQKICEGQYVRLKDNLRIEGSEQNWILWRLPDGYELEDHFQLQVDPAAQLLSQLGAVKIGPELRKELESKASETDFVVRYGPDRRPQSLTVHGKKVLDGRAIEMVKCEVNAKEVRCQSRDQRAKLRVQESDEFFYAFPFAMLFSAWLPKSAGVPTEKSKLAVLNYGDKLDLTSAERSVQSVEDETLTVGDRQFQAHKAKIIITYQDRKPLELTIWYGAPGLVYALEGGGPRGERMALVQYKKYSD